MTVGIDSGTSLTKFAWQRADAVQFRSTASSTIDDIYGELQQDGITTARVFGAQSLEHPFEELPRHADPIKEETRLQARGARHLAGVGGCLVVSIGTGVSYTRVLFGKALRMPVGSSLGGGFLTGMRSIARNVPWTEFDDLAMSTKTPDLMVGDLYPDHPAKDLVLANFGSYNGTNGEVCSGAVSVVATGIVKDLVLYSILTKHVVFVGTAAQLQSLQIKINAFQPLLKKQFHFPENGAFAGALGAMLDS
jgi:pantothenate kinase